MQNSYSVLMSVYRKETPEYLRQSIDSMFSQTVLTDDFVLICDGELTKELDEVIKEYQLKYPSVLNVVRLPENKGLGNALSLGVTLCKNDVIARMDSDDISRPERCEKELAFLNSHPEISVVGSIIEEFSDTPAVIDSVRNVPETPEEIVTFSKKRCPFNHPSVMYRKKDVLDAGNYRTVRNIQDYYLWIDMLIKGYKGYNLQIPLVYMRVNEGLFRRRGGKQYVKLQLDLFKIMKDAGYINFGQYIFSVIIRACSASAPSWVRRIAFKLVLRK